MWLFDVGPLCFNTILLSPFVCICVCMCVYVDKTLRTRKHICASEWLSFHFFFFFSSYSLEYVNNIDLSTISPLISFYLLFSFFLSCSVDRERMTSQESETDINPPGVSYNRLWRRIEARHIITFNRASRINIPPGAYCV